MKGNFAHPALDSSATEQPPAALDAKSGRAIDNHLSREIEKCQRVVDLMLGRLGDQRRQLASARARPSGEQVRLLQDQITASQDSAIAVMERLDALMLERALKRCDWDEPRTEEKRRHVRAPLAMKIELSDGHEPLLGVGNDISEGGLFIASHDVYAIGDQLALEFRLPGNSRPIHCQAEVSWLSMGSDGRGRGMGVRFLDLAPQDARTIAAFVTRRTPGKRPASNR